MKTTPTVPHGLKGTSLQYGNQLLKLLLHILYFEWFTGVLSDRLYVFHESWLIRMKKKPLHK